MIDNYYVTVVIDDGIVTQVYVPLKPLCVSTVVEAYGLPTKVERDFGENRHRLIYAEEKLAFASDWKDPTRISGVYLVSERGFDEWLQTSSHMEDWEDMSEVFAGECHDNLSGQAVP
jgi:hypothetical protein